MLENEYALAIFELATELNIVNDVKDELNALIELLNDEEINKVLNSLSINIDNKKEIINNSLIGFNEITLNFINVLLDNKRFYLINNIYEEYNSLILNSKETNIIDVYSSTKLTNKQIEKLKPSIISQLGVKNIIINNIIDENLIGGIKICAKDKIIDLSAKNSLAKLKNSL